MSKNSNKINLQAEVVEVGQEEEIMEGGETEGVEAAEAVAQEVAVEIEDWQHNSYTL